MKYLISDSLRRIASTLDRDLKKVDDSDKTVVFLGGDVTDRYWRKEIKEEFSDKIMLLDPYDKDWEAEDNIYKELEGLMKSDYVVFYNGGEGSKKEQEFLDHVKKGGYKEFNNIKELKDYLSSISSKMKKEAYPTIGQPASDLKLEKLDKESIESLIEDLKKGVDIKVDPRIHSIPDMSDLQELKAEDVKREVTKGNPFFNVLLEKYKKLPGSKNPVIKYDKEKHMYIPTELGQMSKSAKHGQVYKRSSTQFDFPEKIADKVLRWSKKNVPDSILGEEGREDEVHVTVLYGLFTTNPLEVEEIIKKYKIEPFDVRLSLITAFMNGDQDVLKIDVESNGLHNLHKLLRANIDNDNKYPEYRPHVTIAYLKKGESENYIGRDDFQGISCKVNNIVFSSKTGEKIEIPLVG
jgi:2'-5' RNA ligase